MKFKGKIKLGEISIPQEDAKLKDIEIEFEGDYQMSEIKECVELYKEIPQAIEELATGFFKTFKKLQAMEQEMLIGNTEGE